MEESKKEQYITGIIGTIIGIILFVISFQMGIKESGWITAIFGLLFGGMGILSFFNPEISQILKKIMDNISENQKKEEINQKQHNPKKSPQTGIINGNQHIYYEKETPKNNYNKEKIEKRLNEIKLKLKKLKLLNHEEGSKLFSPLKKEIKGIIHKVYSSSPEASEKRLIHKVFWMITSSTKESDYQRWYVEDVEGLIDTTEIILREMDLD